MVVIIPGFWCLQLRLADRSLMPGDVVRRLIEGQDSQRGFVRTTKVSCHCHILTTRDKVILNVDSTRLEPHKVCQGDATKIPLLKNNHFKQHGSLKPCGHINVMN
jgi:hypothetical protein